MSLALQLQLIKLLPLAPRSLMSSLEIQDCYDFCRIVLPVRTTAVVRHRTPFSDFFFPVFHSRGSQYVLYLRTITYGGRTQREDVLVSCTYSTTCNNYVRLHSRRPAGYCYCITT